jgi:hypothetical protein
VGVVGVVCVCVGGGGDYLAFKTEDV